MPPICIKVSVAAIAGCYGMRRVVESDESDTVLLAADEAVNSVGTLPYETRFGSGFSLADVEADIRRQMCEVYLAPVATNQLAWTTVSCQDWVAENVVVDDGPMITASAGDPSNPLVIFIHGWPDNVAIWVNQFMFLSQTYRCVAVQLPNYLDAMPTEELYIDEVIDRVGEVLAGRQAFLVAHDWGANFGYMVAYKFPDLILKYAALDIGNDIQMWLDAQNPSITSPMATFIRFYQTRLAAAYRNPNTLNNATVSTFALTGGSPGGHATARMGMYYDRVWNRPEFQRRLAPDVPEDEWQGLWTPLGGTGIPQRGMLYIQGSNLATTPTFLDAVRADGGRVIEMMDGGHWIPMGAAAAVSAELTVWLGLGVGDEGEIPEEYPLVFSLPEAEHQLRDQMCGEYWVQDAHPLLTDCMSEVQQKITIEAGPLVTARAGDPSNQMIVFIHGWPDTAALWVNQLLRFSQSYYCVAVQLPNYLDALPTEELFIDEVVARIGAVIGNRETLLVGHDWGANLGYMVAYKFPDVVLRYAALDIANDLQMWIDVAPETRDLTSPMSVFIAYYQTRLAAAYRNCFTGRPIVELFARSGGSPGGRATCRMGMLYDRAWERTEFQQRMAPDVPVENWQSLWTPLGGTGIRQSGMLYIQGSTLATTDKFLDAVRADDGTVVQLLDGQAGHWLPVQGTTYVNQALESWFAGSGADILDVIPYDSLSFTACSPLVVQDVYAHGFRFTDVRRSANKMSFYVRCAGDVSEEPSTNKISCQQDYCGGLAWCFVANRCRSSWGFRTCSALSNQNPLNCMQTQ